MIAEIHDRVFDVNRHSHLHVQQHVLRWYSLLIFCFTSQIIFGNDYLTAIAPAIGDTHKYFDFTLEELVDMEVTSVSKKSEKLSETAAAVYVITQEDIRRSGVTSIPEALRMVPGLNVRRINSNIWSIAIRGIHGRFLDNLLVLIDGLSLIRQASGSTRWEATDIVLADVDRIEIIRGPGATIWGSNAVDGVINIVTKPASATEGGLFEIGAGNEERIMTNFRYGDRINQDIYFRVYGKYFDRDSFATTVANDPDSDWQVFSGGLRLDWDISIEDRLQFQANYFHPDSVGTLRIVDLAPDALPPYEKLLVEDIEYHEYNFMVNWQRDYGSGSGMKLLAYYVQNDFKEPNGVEHERSVTLEFQNNFPIGGHSEVNWGIEYRHWDDIGRSTEFTRFLNGDGITEHFFNTYVQNRIQFFEERISLTLGSKFEHNDFIDWEIQPSARLLLKINNHQSFWSSVSRAVSMPTRSEKDGFIFLDRSPFMTTIQGIQAEGTIDTIFVGDSDLKSEELIAYEMGYRLQISDRIALDFATFYNDYSDVPTTQATITGDIVGLPDENGIFPATGTALLKPSHEAHAESYGMEVNGYWQLANFWRIAASYTWIRFDFDNLAEFPLPNLDTAENVFPINQIHLRSFLDLPYQLQFDTLIYYSDNTRFTDLSIASHIRLDIRLAWHPFRNLEISAIAQDILDKQHPEHGSFLGFTNPVEAEQSYYGTIRWTF